MVFLCSCGGLIWENRIHVCGQIRCSCGAIKFNGRGHCCGYTPNYSVPPTNWELYSGYRTSDEWMGSTTWGKRSPRLFNTMNQEIRILNGVSAMEDIKNITQTGYFKDYCVAFDILLTKVILSEDYATKLFIMGLKSEIRMWVQLLNPKTLMEAYEMARNQNNLLAYCGYKGFQRVEIEVCSANVNEKGSDINIQPIDESENRVEIKETVHQDSCDGKGSEEIKLEMGFEKQNLHNTDSIENHFVNQDLENMVEVGIDFVNDFVNHEKGSDIKIQPIAESKNRDENDVLYGNGVHEPMKVYEDREDIQETSDQDSFVNSCDKRQKTTTDAERLRLESSDVSETADSSTTDENSDVGETADNVSRLGRSDVLATTDVLARPESADAYALSRTCETADVLSRSESADVLASAKAPSRSERTADALSRSESVRTEPRQNAGTAQMGSKTAFGLIPKAAQLGLKVASRLGAAMIVQLGSEAAAAVQWGSKTVDGLFSKTAEPRQKKIIFLFLPDKAAIGISLKAAEWVSSVAKAAQLNLNTAAVIPSVSRTADGLGSRLAVAAQWVSRAAQTVFALARLMGQDGSVLVFDSCD